MKLIMGTHTGPTSHWVEVVYVQSSQDLVVNRMTWCYTIPLPCVSSFSCSCKVLEALYVRNTLAVNPSISSDKCLFSIIVCNMSQEFNLHSHCTSQSGCYTYCEPIKKVVSFFLVLQEESDILEDLLVHWDAIVVADGILPKKVELDDKFFAVHFIMKLFKRVSGEIQRGKVRDGRRYRER